ncbi:cobalt-precorrin-6x reductase [Roseivivax halodurans JCM 10272]|uniref:Cobalt-precorrin-6x reductase n=1 Tax=Roseivivax halodurans JCM 10272 TaxID=1449350 RepID=X7EEW8_9RHOB|nr:cobalt-precorrin-6A reductase [Roseivivax halodurans]ETX13678.1 cobalt-precorrin-6x reductase [Roseivivax halodurans JCM 10272]
MGVNLLILAGTSEATAFARAAAEAGLAGTVSFAGRVARPLRQPLPQRTGGFGGVAGLRSYLRAEGITHVVDATHPFAAAMSRNAVAACAAENLPLVALTRPEWAEQPGDRWTRVADFAGAVAALDRPAASVMLAIGRMHLGAFAGLPQHRYLLRLVDPPETPPPFPRHEVIVDRGPFDTGSDRALMEEHGLDIVVSKNSGGTGAYAKIAAARELGLPVVMIDRPAQPERKELHDAASVLDWVTHAGADLGV